MGGDLYQYSSLDNVIKLFSEIRDLKIDLRLDSDSVCNYGLSYFDNLPINKLEILITDPRMISETKSVSLNCKKKVELLVPIQSEKEIEILEDGPQIQFLPLFNGKNIDFLRKYLFINETDLFESNSDSLQILLKSIVNPYFFGNLIIDPYAKIYSSVFGKPLGKLAENESIKKAIVTELTNGNFWKLIRTNVPVCKDCVYNLLCPPISYHELIQKKYNLCNIN
jgi:pseudo-rSAM protein